MLQPNGIPAHKELKFLTNNLMIKRRLDLDWTREAYEAPC